VILLIMNFSIRISQVWNTWLTSPMKNLTATSPERTASYCIQDLLRAIRRSKLFPVENTPINKTSLFLGIAGAFRFSTSTIISLSSVTGKPLARTDNRLKLPATLIVLTNHGSSFCIHKNIKCWNGHSNYLIFSSIYLPISYLPVCKRCFMPSIYSHMKSFWPNPQCGSERISLRKREISSSMCTFWGNIRRYIASRLTDIYILFVVTSDSLYIAENKLINYIIESENLEFTTKSFSHKKLHSRIKGSKIA